ncbi:cell division cycle-associated protein 7-like isoform X2 [Telopea speciosissima]|uniref:cell division cycle-associated protein 7-like isoform X2 n=1 Tax=Telopea speciosissima TaxID=54955 RepID=UPI001CC3EC48|nr:cell division cycle-associated protein 7-like isoform X2 [Telopea speciosissima]
MVTLRKRARTSETPANAKESQNDKNPTDGAGDQEGYEQCRDKRIKENMERMQKLGILDLSLKLKSGLSSPKRTPRNTSERKTPHPSPLLSSAPSRRSSRLQNASPVNYSELPVPKKNKSGSLDDKEPFMGEGEKPEIYTEEDEKLLGTCETPWTLFVDGYGKDGKRIYDSVNGKTCHQCRQKTLGHRTHCIKCNIVQGQFCGDCLYMRYGENILEANQNPNWICPVCRGICNCSVCRLRKGWVPTGYLYRKVSLGYKSVAHYLIQTRRPQTNLEEDPGTEHPVSAKSSLACEDSEGLSQQKPLDYDDGNHECSKPQFEDDDGTKGKKVEVQSMHTEHDVSNSASEGDSKLRMNHVLATEVCQESIAGRQQSNNNTDDCNRCTMSEIGNSQDDEKSRVGKEVGNTDDVEIISDTASESDQKPLAFASKLIPDSIVRRLRPRHNRS